MKKTWILLAVVVMVAGLLAAPGTALAAKGGQGNKPDKTPGVTCAEFPELYSASDGFWFDAASGGFSFNLKPGETACWDVSAEAAGDWTVAFTDSYVRSLVLQIKDSIPGDICWQTQLGPGQLDATVTAQNMPGEAIDACGEKWSDSDDRLVFVAASGDSAKGKKAKTVETVTITVTLPTN